MAFFHRSTTAAAALTENQKLLKMPIHKLIQDVATRWNSAFEMMRRYLEQQAPVMAALVALDMKKNARTTAKDIVLPTNEEISNLEKLVQALEPVNKVTELMYTTKKPTISLILPPKDRLIQNLAPQAGDNTLVRV